MALRFHITRSRREKLPALALLFLLQSLAPAFLGVLASPVAGYVDVICTMSGPQRVFVPFEGEERQQPRACHECPSCILQLGFDDDTLLAAPVEPPRLESQSLKTPETTDPLLVTRNHLAYLSRAPPA
jgi:hypothetical protein